ncbi:MAG: hypothetical protein LCH30_01385 [Proteobacteria bacterium]|nr:hypothetical protein [Pseudomonadota bacterium]
MKKIIFAILISFIATNLSFAKEINGLAKQAHFLAQNLISLSQAQTDTTCTYELVLASGMAENAGREISNKEFRKAVKALHNSLKSVNYTISLDCEKKEEINIEKMNLVSLMYEIAS